MNKCHICHKLTRMMAMMCEKTKSLSTALLSTVHFCALQQSAPPLLIQEILHQFIGQIVNLTLLQHAFGCFCQIF